METTQNKPSDFLTPRELADKLGMSLKWVTNQTQARRVPGQIKMGHSWRYKSSEVEKRLLSEQFLLEK